MSTYIIYVRLLSLLKNNIKINKYINLVKNTFRSLNTYENLFKMTDVLMGMKSLSYRSRVRAYTKRCNNARLTIRAIRHISICMFFTECFSLEAFK